MLIVDDSIVVIMSSYQGDHDNLILGKEIGH